jgi:cell division septal protein FtsQ
VKKILPAALLIIAIFLLISALRVNQVEISQNSCLKTAPDYKGKFIFTVNTKQEEENLKRDNPCLAAVKLEKVYPSKIKIIQEAENPVARIAGTQYFVTSGGLVVESSARDLPQIFFPEPANVVPGGQITGDLAKTAVKIAGLLAKSDFHPTNVRILNSEDIAVYDAAETVVIFSKEKSQEEQVDSLQQVIAIAKIDNDKIAKIDLRFDKPTIVYK